MHSLEDGRTAQGLLGCWEQLVVLPQNTGLGRRSATSPCLSSRGFSCLSPCQEGAAGTALSCQLCLAISSSSWHKASFHPSATTHPAHALPCSSQSHKPPDLSLAPRTPLSLQTCTYLRKEAQKGEPTEVPFHEDVIQQPPKKWACHVAGQAFSKTPSLTPVRQHPGRLLKQAEKKEEKERRNLLARKAGFLSAACGTGGETWCRRAATRGLQLKGKRPQQEELVLYEGC